MRDLTLRVRSSASARPRVSGHIRMSSTAHLAKERRSRTGDHSYGDPPRGDPRQSWADYLDMLSKALREYDTVSVEPSTDGRSAVLFEKGASRAGIDVRRFPWIRPLSGDYAYNFDRVASLYAGDPTRPEAWSDVIGRVQAQKRHRREIVDVLAAQQARRNAPPEARAAVAQLADPKAVAILTGQQA